MMLPRRAVLATLGAATLVASSLGWAQEAGRTYRLGFVVPSPRSEGFWTILFDELRRAGFVEGGNLQVVGEFGVTPGRADAVAGAAVKAGADVIFTAGPECTRAAQDATKTIPISAYSGDLVAERLVASLAHPGGNTTGVSILAPEIDTKRQDMLFDMLPGIRRIGALVDPSARTPAQLETLAAAAGSRGATLSIHRASRNEEIIPAIDAARAVEAQALNVIQSPLTFVNYSLIIEHVAKVRLPAIYGVPEFADRGGLVAYGPRVATLIPQIIVPQLVKLLRGAKPAQIPVERPTIIELALNLKTAKALDLVVPTAFLTRADKVIE
ncbi:ABC transporter substrate-binding protein [Bradyrhizobium sp. CNPSo 4010]|uniref:ABC transporter substrate-binding protein n=1 Tax=Bradyrhizobium agreste TaxID=2751811 RepID=A0ABS0PNR6_9BRAD|nr:ABC transporter substrate-binding protein [Bradyrhizobium agreste]MBH5398735.1 ABC transporter substrate-binding protein [Bradyrhizobium agreste]